MGNCAMYISEHVIQDDFKPARMKQVKTIEAGHCSLSKAVPNVRFEEEDVQHDPEDEPNSEDGPQDPEEPEDEPDGPFNWNGSAYNY